MKIITNKIEKGILSLATFLLLTGCGSGDISSLTNTGQLVDSNISGVDYSTSSGKSGTTDINGYFSYLPTDTNISFSIGALKLPDFNLSAIKGDGRILPTDFAGVDRNNTTDSNVTKLLRLFQSLDDDNNASNGINITAITRSRLTTSLKVFDMNITALSNMVINDVNKSFITESQARRHYQDTLKDLNISYTEINASVVAVTTSGKLVDPYISGAILCQDTNDNNSCDSDEPVSTSTTTTGEFTFSETLTAGKNIIIKTQGTHEGETYDLNISGVVNSNGTIAVVSPLTTFQSKGLSATQIAAIFTKAKTDAIANDSATNLGSFDANATTILNDPLSGGLMDKTVSQVSNADLSNIQASVSSYALLKIMNGSSTLSALSGSALETSGTTTGSVINLIARATLTQISNALNTALLTNLNTGIASARSGLVSNGVASDSATSALPEVTIGMVVKVAVKIVDQVAKVGYETCNSTSGDDDTKVTAALTAVVTKANQILTQSKIMELGTKIYGVTNKDAITTNLSAGILTALAGLSPDLATGYTSDSNTTFKFADNGDIITH